MPRSRDTLPIAARRRQPDLEVLEVRTLLSLAPAPTRTGTLAATAPLSEVDAQIKASETRATYGVDGSGLAVAVIDMGISAEHPAFGGQTGPHAKVKTGFDFAEGDENPHADANQHGTSVAGLIASEDPAALGVAPGADIVPLRVYGDDDAGSYAWIADALKWVLANYKKYNISVVNISSTDSNNHISNIYAKDPGVGQRITNLIGDLSRLNIAVVSAAGNSFSGAQGMGFSAIVADTISVTATDGKGQLAPDAQRLGTSVGGAFATDVAAPGVGLLAPSGSSGYATLSGTSFATPLVSGAILLLQEIYESRFGELPTIAMVESWLEGGSRPAVDPRGEVSIGQLDIAAAAALIPTRPASDPTPPTNTPEAPPGNPGGNAPTTPPPTTPPVQPETPPASTPDPQAPPTIVPPSTPPVDLPPAHKNPSPAPEPPAVETGTPPPAPDAGSIPIEVPADPAPVAPAPSTPDDGLQDAPSDADEAQDPETWRDLIPVPSRSLPSADDRAGSHADEPEGPAHRGFELFMRRASRSRPNPRAILNIGNPRWLERRLQGPGARQIEVMAALRIRESLGLPKDPG